MKANKAYAGYQDHPQGAQRCDKCTMFRAPDVCTKVAGKISAHGWCRRYYDPKTKEK